MTEKPTAPAAVGLQDALRQGCNPSEDDATQPPTSLYRISQIESGEPVAEDLGPLCVIVTWMRDFLCQPHPDLGRTGPVCPFMPIAMKLDSLFLTCIHLKSDAAPEHVGKIASQYRDVFLHQEPRYGDESVNKALLMLFPDIDEAAVPELIDGVQATLKKDFTRCGLMLGEFHAKNQTPGLRSDKIRPLRSPIPMLVIRHMVETDLPFLSRPRDTAGARVGFLRAYLRRLGQSVSEQRLDRAIDALVEAEIELRGLAPQEIPPARPPLPSDAAEI